MYLAVLGWTLSNKPRSLSWTMELRTRHSTKDAASPVLIKGGGFNSLEQLGNALLYSSQDIIILPCTKYTCTLIYFKTFVFGCVWINVKAETVNEHQLTAYNFWFMLLNFTPFQV